MVFRDERETTVVTREEHLGDVDVIERNRDLWQLINLEPPTPFYCVGFLAKVSALLAGEGIDILVVSTFSRDCVLVKVEDGAKAIALLEGAGFISAVGS